MTKELEYSSFSFLPLPSVMERGGEMTRDSKCGKEVPPSWSATALTKPGHGTSPLQKPKSCSYDSFLRHQRSLFEHTHARIGEPAKKGQVR